MWQSPGGLSGPPDLNGGNEDEPAAEQPPLHDTTSNSSLENTNSQCADSRDILHIPSGIRVTRGVVSRRRGPRRPANDRVNTGLRQENYSPNNVSQHTSSWILKQRRCSDQPSRRHFRMANLYDIQYSSNDLLPSISNEVISNVNNEDESHRLLSKRRRQESNSDQSSNDEPSENLAMWPLKSRLSNTNEDFNIISSLSRPQLLTTETSQCSSDSSTDSVIPELFSARISNSISNTDYSTDTRNTTSMSCSNQSSTFENFSTTQSINGVVTSKVLPSSDSFINDSISTEMTSAKLYGSERSFSKSNDNVALLELHKVSGPTKLDLPPSTIQTRKVANRVITHTRIYKTPDERFIWCLSCDRIPTLPVTGQCGHTRCSKCVKENDTCPCGTVAPKSPCVNTVIQAIIDKMLHYKSGTRFVCKGVVLPNELSRRKPSIAVSTRPCPRTLRSANGFISTKKYYSAAGMYEGRIPMTPQGRVKRARELLSRGEYRAAVPQLARAAASSATSARVARALLAQAISALSQDRDPRRLTRELYKSIRQQSAVSWLKPSDLECVLCYHTYTSPVTTPCGHTYCRTCIERSLDYRKTCALCLRPLDDFNLAATRETEFVSAALAAIDAVSAPSPPDPDVIPIFVCTVAFPSIPCPLFIFDPRYWLMIRRILESGSRKFGMVSYERDRSYSDYGTVLEVCDCVHLEDGRSILSTVGVSRFRVIERDVRDGCDVARIQPLVDASPTDDVVWELRMMATQISYKALVWLESMNRAVRAEIEAAFGAMPHFHTTEEWWERADGPQWLWWLIAILPLRSEIKILILSTRSLLKRMMAVSRTLEVMDSVAFTNNNNSVCDLGTTLSTEDWLERNA